MKTKKLNTYEAPEVESIEMKFNNSILEGTVCVGDAEDWNLCPENEPPCEDD